MFGERKKLAHLQEPLGLEPEYVVKNCMIALVWMKLDTRDTKERCELQDSTKEQFLVFPRVYALGISEEGHEAQFA